MFVHQIENLGSHIIVHIITTYIQVDIVMNTRCHVSCRRHNGVVLPVFDINRIKWFLMPNCNNNENTNGV